MGRGCSKTIIRINLVEVKHGQNEPAEVEGMKSARRISIVRQSGTQVEWL
jgi:hypothetical protein